MKRGLIIGGLVIFAILAIVVFGSRREEQEGGSEIISTQTEITLPTVSVAEIGEHDLNEIKDFHGRFAANSLVGVTPKVPGRVDEVFVRVGDVVKIGDAIAQMETEELKLQVRQAEAVLQAAEANLARIKSGVRAEELEQAAAGFKQSQANYNGAKLNYDRSEVLFREGVISAREWEGIEVQYEGAKAQLVNAEKNLFLMQQGAREEDIKSAEASVAQAQVTLELAELNLRNTRITSPIDGHISRLSVEKGATAGAGVPVATVVDIDTVKLHLQITGRDIARLREGQRTQITVDAYPARSFEGKVATISPAAEEGSGLFAVTFGVPNPDTSLRPGMYGTAHVTLQERKRVTAVPIGAVSSSGGRNQVFIVEGDTVRLVQVQTGLVSNDLVEIRSGVSVGDNVVVVGRESLRDGMKVRLADWRDSG